MVRVCRRYIVLTKDSLLTFREKGNYSSPTEVIRMETCSTVKSCDEEINKEYSFVSEHRLAAPCGDEWRARLTGSLSCAET